MSRWIYQVDPVQDADPQRHEGFGEVDHLLSLRGDGEAGDCQVCFLQTERERGMINNYHNFSLCKVITWIEEEEDMWIRSEGVERRAEGGRETLLGRRA